MYDEILETKGFAKYGLRVMTGGKKVSVGDCVENSFVWVDGEITEEELEGASALDLEFDGWNIPENRLEEMLEQAKDYESNNQIVIIGGNESYEGNDINEVVISGAVCVAVIK